MINGMIAVCRSATETGLVHLDPVCLLDSPALAMAADNKGPTAKRRRKKVCSAAIVDDQCLLPLTTGITTTLARNGMRLMHAADSTETEKVVLCSSIVYFLCYVSCLLWSTR